MAVFNNILAGASGQSSGGSDAGYQIERSLRFNSADSSYLAKNVPSAGDRRTHTFSFWHKSTTSGQPVFFNQYTSGTQRFTLQLTPKLQFISYNSNGDIRRFQSEADFRDHSAWYHFVVTLDTTNTTAADKIKVWANGERLTAATYVAPGDNEELFFNQSGDIEMMYYGGGPVYYSGYLAEVYFIEKALEASDFGEYVNGVWQPKQYTGGFDDWFNNSQTWSSGLVSSTGSFYSGRPAASAFDGDLNDWANPSTGNGSSLTFTPPSTLTYSSSIEIYCLGNGTHSLNGGTAGSHSANTWATVATGSGTINSLVVTGSPGYPALAAIKVDGQYLIDSGVTGIANNSFHLDFSDNSSNSALGTDSSGNSNTWTVNNIAAKGSDWNQSQAWSTSGTITGTAWPDGNSTYAGVFSGGSLTSIAAGNYAFADGDDTYRYTFANNGLSVSSYVKVYYWKNGGTLRVNAGETDEQAITASTSTYTSTTYTASTISVLKNVEVETSGTTGPYLIAIEVDGDVLVDSGINDTAAKNIDSLLDSPTDYNDGTNVGGNYCTLNPLSIFGSASMSNGNLDGTCSASTQGLYGTIAMSSGKWYWEITNNSAGGMHGIANLAYSDNNWNSGTGGYFYYYGDGNKYSNSNTPASYGDSYTTGDIIGVAYDADNGNLYFYKNGTVQNSGTAAFTGLSGTFAPFFQDGSGGTHTFSVNFGQRQFAYPPGSTNGPSSDYKALCTQNLEDPVIENPSDYFDTKVYTGNGAGLNVGGDGITYSNLLTASSGSFTTAEPAVKAFDGLTSTVAKAANTDAILTFDISSLNLTGLLEIWVTNSSSDYSIDGGTTWNSSTSSNWTTIASDISGVSNIQFRPSSGTKMKVAAIRSQGTILVNSTGDPYNFSPDFVWIKNRDSSGTNQEHHALFDRIRGATKVLYSSLPNAEATQSNGLTSFTSDGFNVGTDGKVNKDTEGHVAWAWDAGNDANPTSISAGSLNSTVYDQSQTWSSYLTGNNLADAAYAFDGSTSTIAQSPNAAGAYLMLTYTFTNVTSLRVYASNPTNNEMRLNNTGSYTAESSLGASNNAGWRDLTSLIPSNGTVTHIEAQNSGTNTNGVNWAAIEVNGRLLINSGVSVTNFPATASTYHANPTSGFSIVSYSGSLTSADNTTVGHGLNAAPEFVITKSTSSSRWCVFPSALGANKYLELNTTAAADDSAGVGGGSAPVPTSSVIYTPWLLGSNVNGEDFIAYCFAPVKNYSQFGVYEANGLADGPFVYTGFKPKFILIKRTDSTGGWNIVDTTRSPHNVVNTYLYANEKWEEDYYGSVVMLDILSNGFKLRSSTTAEINAASGTHIYAAFAEHPFKTARAS